ncbi:MAG: Ig-like domain-containing protein [Chloroflexota bacterium]
MRLKTTVQLSWFLLIVALVLVACGGEAPEDEALPTVAPTAVSATETPEPVESNDSSTNEEAIAAAEPTPEPIEPDPVVSIASENIDWPPQLIYSSPQLGEQVRLDGAITLRFDQPMDQVSVEAAFAIEPAVEGEFMWSRPDTVIFTPRSKLARRQSYQVAVGETAVSQNGLPLSQAIALELQTVGSLEVSQLIPTADGRGIEPDSDITVIFNRPVVPLTSTSNQTDLPQPLTISPETAGIGEWVSTSIYRFVPDEPLQGATNYSVEIDGALTDIVGATLESSPSWQFTTESPTVLIIEPEFTRPVRPDQPIAVRFNTPMDRASTENATSLSGGADNAPVVFEWSENDEVVVVSPERPLFLDTEYQFSVGTDALAASGLINLTQPGRAILRTVPLPAVLSTFPNDSQPPDRYQRGFNINFVSPMDFETLDGRLIIDPPPRVEPNYFYDEFNYQLHVNFALEGNTDYTITIPADVADPYGNTLGEPYTWTFTSAELPAVVSFNLPPQISHLSTSFPSDIELIHRNVREMDVTLYNLGLPLNLINEPYTSDEYRPAADPIGSFGLTSTLEQGVVGLDTVQLANGGVLPTGVYMVTLSSPDLGEDSRYWQNQRNLLVVSDANLVVKEMLESVHVWVTDIASGQPVGGRNLTLYSQRGATLGTAVSDSNGFASFDYDPAEQYLEGVTVVSNNPGESGFGVASSRWMGNVNLWELGIQSDGSPEPPTFSYIYTDRPIYRPGDTVYFKGIVRQPNYGRYALPQETTLQLRITGAFYDPEGGLDETLTVAVDGDGSFSGEFLLGEDMTLGNYQFWFENANFNSHRQFAVAEYRAPEFQVLLTPEQPELLRGEPVDVELESTFFFGGSASDLAVNWTIYEDSFHPNVPGPFYAFGDFGGFFYQDQGPFFGGGGQFGNYLLNEIGMTDENGRLTITLPANLLADAEVGSRRVTVEATLQDEANLPVSATTELVFHSADGYVGITPADYVTFAGSIGTVNLITTDWDGAALPNQNVEVVFYRREWTRIRDTEFGIYRTVWEAEDSEVARATVTTDATGKATADFIPESGGTYIAVATLTDGSGREAISSTTLWSIDPAFVGWRTDPAQRSMPLLPDQDEYQVGDTARLLVQSPFAETTQAWLTIERGNLIEQRVITLNGSTELLEIPITADYAPNVHVTVTAVKPVAADSETPYADVRLGIAELVVSPAQLELNVELTPQQDLFGPRETAVYDVQITDYAGNPVAAELSLALVDLAVLSLLEDNAPPILEAFYQRQPLRSQTGGSLFISGEGLEPEIPLDGGGLGGGGGAELARASVALDEEGEEDPARSNFPDTAYWEAKVVTDANGRATVEIPLPDTLTTWRLSSKAVTADTLVGQAEVDIAVSLPLLVRPTTPRFFTVTDVVQVGAIVNNNTGEDLETVVSLEAMGLTVNSSLEQTVMVPANGRSLVRWEVVVQDTDFADLTFRAVSGELRDATKPSFGVGPDQLIPIYRYTGDDMVGTSGVLTEAGRQVEAILLPETADLDQGSVDATLSPSLAAAMIDALKATNNLEYETDCAHAAAYRLQPNVAAAVVLRELDINNPDLANELDVLIPAAIDTLERQKLAAGGWGWCYTQELDPYLTANILLTLVKAEQAGYDVPSQAMSEGALQLRGILFTDNAANLREPWEISRWVFYTYVLAETGDFLPEIADGLFEAHRGLMAPSTIAQLALTYELIGATGNAQDTLLANLDASGVVSATGVHWEDDTPDAWRHLASDVRETAVVVDVLSQIDPENELLPSAVRWLMSHRTRTYWATPLETAWGVQALGNWLLASGELESEFDYQLAVNLNPLTTGTFAEATASEELSVPLGELLPNEVNFFDVQRGAGNGRLYYTFHLNAALDASQVGPVNRGLTIQRTYYDANCDLETDDCQPISEIAAGEQVRVVLDITVDNNMSYVVVEDPLPAGGEGIDPGLATSQSALGPETVQPTYRRGYWGYWFFNRIQFRDEKVVFMSPFLPEGTYQYSYVMQTTLPGSFQVRPAFGYQEFFPEVNGRSAGGLFVVIE